MAPPAPVPLPPQSPEEIAAIQAREDAMDDAEYVATKDGQLTARQLVNRISPTSGTPGPIVQANFNALDPPDRGIVKAFLRSRVASKKKLTKKEENILRYIRL